MLSLPSLAESVSPLATAGGNVADVRVCELELNAYQGAPWPLSPTYAAKPLVETPNGPLVAELAILRFVEQQGFTGVWLDSFHGSRKYWNSMPSAGNEVTLPFEQQELLDRIRIRHGKRGGAWDVFCWRGDEHAFLESKGPGDRLGPNQRSWFASAIAEGLSPDAFTIVEWSWAGPARPPRKSPTGGSPQAARQHSPRLPTVAGCDGELPPDYLRGLGHLGISSVMDNTLRRLRAGRTTYPSRVAALAQRGLVSFDGDGLTEAGDQLLGRLDDLLGQRPYPQRLMLDVEA